MTLFTRGKSFLKFRFAGLSAAVGSLILPVVVFALATAVPARANNIPFGLDCSASWSAAIAICAGGISGFEEAQLSFFGSDDASDSNVSFTPVSYYSSYTPKARGAASNADDFAADGWVDPTPQAVADPPAEISGSTTSDLVFNTTSSNITTSDVTFTVTLTPLSDPPAADVSAVPEPRFTSLALFAIGFVAFGIYRRLERRGQRSQTF